MIRENTELDLVIFRQYLRTLKSGIEAGMPYDLAKESMLQVLGGLADDDGRFDICFRVREERRVYP